MKNLTRAEVLEVTGLKLGTWNAFVRDGVIAKSRKYELPIVLDQIYKHYIKKHKMFASDIGGLTTKLRKTEEKLIKAEYELEQVKRGLSVNPEGGVVDQPLGNSKEDLDRKLLIRRIAKMDMDQAIRQKQHVPVELLVELVSTLAKTMGTAIDPILPLVKRTVPEMPASTYGKLEKDLAKLRNNIAAYHEGDQIERVLEDYEPKGYFDEDA